MLYMTRKTQGHCRILHKGGATLYKAAVGQNKPKMADNTGNSVTHSGRRCLSNSIMMHVALRVPIYIRTEPTSSALLVNLW